jgi:hypothetical protein
MSLPMTPNTTCDIYRGSRSPPAAPDVAGVKCFLKGSNRHSINTLYHTHVLYVEVTVDIRDGYGQSAPGQNIGSSSAADTLYIPDKNSVTTYTVAEVRRIGRGTAVDHKRVYLIRTKVVWPSNDL